MLHELGISANFLRLKQQNVKKKYAFLLTGFQKELRWLPK